MRSFHLNKVYNTITEQIKVHKTKYRLRDWKNLEFHVPPRTDRSETMLECESNVLMSCTETKVQLPYSKAEKKTLPPF